MAGLASFDLSTGADLQEVDNAVNQATKEVAQRYDFKGSKCTIAFDRATASITLVADDDFKMKALFDVLQAKLIKRGVPVKNLELGAVTPAASDTVRREIKLTQGIPQEKAKAIGRTRSIRARIGPPSSRPSSRNTTCCADMCTRAIPRGRSCTSRRAPEWTART